MRLDRVRIRNFRSIANIEIKLQPSCRVLVGINESGKSNILRALALLNPDEPISPSDVREFPPDESPDSEAYIRFIFTTDKAERISAFDSFAEQMLVKDLARPIIRVDGKTHTVAEFFDSKTEVLYVVDLRTGNRFWAGWSLLPKSQILPGWKKPALGGKIAAFLSDGQDKGLLSQYKLIQPEALPNLQHALLQEIKPEELNTLVHAALNDSLANKRPGCVFWAYDENNLLPGQIPLDQFTATPDVCRPLKHMFELAGYKDINATITNAQKRPNGLRNVLRRVAESATEHMHSVWSEYAGIQIELYPNGAYIDAGINDTYNLYDLARRSDGFKRFVSFLLTISTQVQTDTLSNVLYLQDEPDSSLHPSGARYLRDELIRISQTNYVVYSTHSIFMIDRDIIDRHLIVRKDAEVTTLEQVNASNIVDEEVIYNALGYSVFEELKPKNFVFEGWRDKKLFQVALTRVPGKYKKLKDSLSSVGICHAKGVKDIGRVTPILELANRGCVIVSDSDNVAIEHQRNYDGYGSWYRYDELLPDARPLTGEDFIKPEVLIAAMQSVHAQHDSLGEIPTAELNVERGRVEIIQRWLQRGGLDKEAVKTRLNEIKESVFTALRPTQIEDRYYELLTELADRLQPDDA